MYKIITYDIFWKVQEVRKKLNKTMYLKNFFSNNYSASFTHNFKQNTKFTLIQATA